MNRRIVEVGVLLAMLLSASESAELTPRVSSKVIASDLEFPPMALRFQKKGQIGNTDYNRRKEDMVECGVPRERYQDSLAYIYNDESNPGESTARFMARKWRFMACMEAKDYLQMGQRECGPEKENRGICK